MQVIGDLIDVGFLGIAGFGVWQGRDLWSRHIELKHAREMEKIGMDRMEKSIQLEINQNKAMAELTQANEDAERRARQRDEIIATERLRVEKMRPALEAGDS